MKKARPLQLGAMAGAAALAILAGWWLVDGLPPADAPDTVVATAATTGPGGAVPATTQPMGDARPTPDAMLNPSLVLIFESALAEAQATGKAAFMAMAPGLLAKRLPAELVARAMGLLERYIDMQEAMQALPPPDAGDPASLLKTIEARAEVRRRYFAPEEIEGLFGDEIRQDALMADKMAIARDANLTPEEREAAAKRSEEALLTPEQREQRRAFTAQVDVQRQTDAMEARGASAQERFAERSATYGYEAARQLAALDQENQDWNSRLDQYANAPPEQQAQLRESLFNERERLRLSGALALRSAKPAPNAAGRTPGRSPS
ncbi:lipase chaperone LimK [Variovorax boronicumulans]|uniref:Lipase helper protein n=1 Tax=Variovorax boronicumulans TaxID=436515 RepID=A0AAW8D4I0_9BURK|nr:lipase secretion chaperone [Variovorax boronicumulans]MDP9897505.1 lipase chaperone LimK [Variovorax boronicumulans]MDQ0057544.1 lipase chaperone LimK [Variovorax boronicumulans]